jgi:hypothetical protein
MNLAATACLIASILLSAARGQDVPPTPKPKDVGPSLEDTMKFLEDKLGAIGQVSFLAYVHDEIKGSDWTNKVIDQISNVHANTCGVNYHEHTLNNDNVVRDVDWGINMKTVEYVTVKMGEQDSKDQSGKEGHPEITLRADRPTFVIRVSHKQNGGWNFFVLEDEALANRIAKAIAHAAELCGGGNKDPF